MIKYQRDQDDEPMHEDHGGGRQQVDEYGQPVTSPSQK